VTRRGDEKALEAIRGEVRELTRAFPLYLTFGEEELL
jgi:hypothetical protein